jgi:hypothetical protein
VTVLGRQDSCGGELPADPVDGPAGRAADEDLLKVNVTEPPSVAVISAGATKPAKAVAVNVPELEREGMFNEEGTDR